MKENEAYRRDKLGPEIDKEEEPTWDMISKMERLKQKERDKFLLEE